MSQTIPQIFFCPCFYASLDCHMVACNNPEHDIKWSGKCLFSVKLISGW